MSAIDSMLAKHVYRSLVENIGKKQVEQIEKELYSWYKMSLEDSMMQFDALDRVLVNMYGKKATLALEKRFVLPIINVVKRDSSDTITISLNDTDLIEQIFTIIKDDSSMKIINMLKEKPITSQQIMTHDILKNDYSEKTIYRKIGELYDMGFIAISGYTKSEDNRRVKIYKSVIDAIDLRIEGNTRVISLTVKKKMFGESLILSTVF